MILLLVLKVLQHLLNIYTYNDINLIIIEKSHRQRQKIFLISINGKSNIFIQLSDLQNFIYYQIT